ncbi:MAG TPA: glycosyltransferase family 4 protein [Gaiellaceae bacterium]
MASPGTQPARDAGSVEPRGRGVGSRRKIACLSRAPWNPYLRLLYAHLRDHGFELAEESQLSVGWLWRSRGDVRFLHVHWPENLYRYGGGQSRVRRALSWVKLGAFAWRLFVARLLGYRLVWTIHQPLPHESPDRRLDRLAARRLARSCHLLLAHDAWTAASAAVELRVPPERIALVPHGSYLDVYPERRSRSEVRAELEIGDQSFVFLSFGELRGYKRPELLLEAFSSASLADARLVVAGHPKFAAVGARLREAAKRDPRIVLLLDWIPEDRVADLFHACDAALFLRSDGGTSGSLVLAVSLGLAVVASDTPTARELTRDGEAGWLFESGSVPSLCAALERACADPEAARARGRRALEIASELDWSDIAARIALLLERVER